MTLRVFSNIRYLNKYFNYTKCICYSQILNNETPVIKQ